MRKWLAPIVLNLLLPMVALAIEAEIPEDARTYGYKPSVLVEGSVGLTWLIVVGLAVIGLAALFLHPRRTHLD